MFIKCLVFCICVLHDIFAISTTEQNITSTNIPNEVCIKHFDRGILKCMKPFVMVSNSYTEAKQQGMDSQNILLKHLCFEYEKMLQCHHSSLANCPTLDNIRKVQGKLGTNWVKNVNRLCIIQSDISNMDTIANETHIHSGILDQKNQVKDMSDLSDIKTNTDVMDNGESNKLPQKKNQLSYWKKMQREKQRNFSKKQTLRHNTDDFDIYSILEHYRHRTGVLIVTNMPSGASRIIMNMLILIICLFVLRITVTKR